MKPTPLARVTAEFGGKDKLADSVAALIEALGAGDEKESKEDLRKRLRSVSNVKLMALQRTLSEVRTRFGSKEKLVDGLLALDGRGKDEGLRARLRRWTVPRLWDRLRVRERRASRAARAA